MIRKTIGWTVFAIFIGVVALYAYMVSQGDAPPPDPEKIRQFAEAASKSGGAIAAILILVLGFLAAIAPIIYAGRSGDAFTFLFAVASLILVFALLVSSRTVIDMVLASIVYFTSAIVSVVVFSTKRISEAIRGDHAQDPYLSKGEFR